MNNNVTKVIEILLVEDHELTRIGLKTALERFDNIRVCGETASGKEAIKLSSELKPQVILMDIALHELDGIEATKQILRKKSSLVLPVAQMVML